MNGCKETLSLVREETEVKLTSHTHCVAVERHWAKAVLNKPQGKVGKDKIPFSGLHHEQTPLGYSILQTT